MLHSCYLREGIVYVPTVATREREPVYTDIEPVAVVPVINTDGVRRALSDSIARKNVVIATPNSKALREPPILLKYAGVPSWSAFFHSASTWSITQKSGAYQILGYRKHPKKYWEEDPSQKTQFPPGTPVDDVIDRMIAILQEAAGEDSAARKK
jgi:hypothetical protein